MVLIIMICGGEFTGVFVRLSGGVEFHPGIGVLETLDFVDKNGFGVTGRSGGGAYSWWISVLDERIKVSAPVAGITSLKNHVYAGFQNSGRLAHGVVEGHCDSMFHVNTYRWDFDHIAALVAPRPLMILNTDDDRIFRSMV